jgi:Chemotaxis protein histidine kinase and related kinases
MVNMSDYLDPNNEELLKDFFAEAEQQVDTLESNILVVENDPTNHEAIDEIFRAAHTLKGGSATVEMTELSGFTHKVEDVLDEIRSDRLRVDEGVVDVLLSSIDVIKAMLEARADGNIYSENIDSLVEKLHAYIPESGKKGSKSSSKAAAKPIAPKPVAAPVASSGFAVQELSDADFQELKEACEDGQKLWCVSVKFDESNPMNSVGGIQVFAALKSTGVVLKTVPDFDALYEDEFYEFVYYYLASKETQEKIEDAAFLGDVTLAVDARNVTGPEKASEGNAAVSETEAAAPEPAAEEPVKENASAVKPETPKPAAPQKQNDAKKDGGHSAQQSSVLRVDSRRIDYLLNLVSEIVINKASFNQLSVQLSDELTNFINSENSFKEAVHGLFERLPSYFEQIKNGASPKEVRDSIIKDYGEVDSIFDTDDANLKSLASRLRSSTQNLGRIAGELQEGVMKIRMVPINQIFSRFPRVVRDLQRDLNKKIDLVIEGEDTELDKSVVEDLLDPIMHCVRNSVDHGIEAPAERLKAGKPETGRVLLKASNEGNLIVIDISDDGAGIDEAKVREKAIKNGLIHPDKVFTDQEAFQLIFLPGFSTSEKITNVSGRGVGLDVVKTMIDKLNGTVTVSSVHNKGTTFSIKLPLTLAIIQGLLVRVGKEVYSIPIASVVESQRIKLSEIKTIDSYEVLNVRNEVISVLRLSRLFKIKESSMDEYCNIVIVGSGDKKVGVMVDSLVGEEDVVIKPLRDQFTNSPGIAGASILGDGSVSLIIDVSQLLDLSMKAGAASAKVLESKVI